MKKKKTRRYSRSFLSMLIHKPLLYLFLIVALPISLWAVGQNQQLASLGVKPTQAPILHTLSVSGSKLGVFMLQPSNGGRKIAQAGPKVIKVMDPQDNQGMMQIVRDYKRSYPEGIVVVRVYEGDLPGYGLNNDPESAAADWWNKSLGPATSKLSPSDKQLITYLSGPNEYGNTPPIKTSEDAVWTAKFWGKLAEIISNNGFLPLMGEIPVGNPDENLVGDLVPALRTLKQVGGAWSYHAYSLDYSTDENTESWTSLRYRKFYDYLRQNYPDVADLPMILTEGGVDKSGNGQTDGWMARGDTQIYENWLTWFDNQIKNDPYIVGVTLFQIGNNSDWKSFNLEPIANWLTSYLGGQPEQTAVPFVIIPTSTEVTTVPATPTVVPQTQIQPSLTPPSSPIVIIITRAPTPTSIPVPTLIPTPTPSFFVTIKANWDKFFISIAKLTKIILP